MTQEEFEAKYPLIIGWIQGILADHASKMVRVDSLGFQRLSQYFSPGLLAHAKVAYVETVPKPPLSQLGLNQFSEFENMKADGITLLDTFFIGQEFKGSESIHFHELVHIVQWKLLGPKAFVAAYADGLERFGYRNSLLEVMAYDAQAQFDKSPQPFDIEKFVQICLK
jgi:hypothetical protein